MTRPTLLDQASAGLVPTGHAEAAGSDAETPGDDIRPGSVGLGRRWWARRYWVGAAVVVLLAATSLAVSVRALSKPTLSPGAVNGMVNSRISSAIDSLQTQPPAGVVVYNQVAPTMVVIQASIPGATSGESLGAGVVVSKTGEILTALHVVDGATSVKVSFSDGTTSPASIQTSDATHDIASLKPEHPPGVIVPAVLGGGVRVGDDVFAIGHPLGLVDTLTAGVVSGLDRTFKANGRSLNGLIQFDAAVNPGNSGGPLVNRQGQVVGIVTGIANPAGVDDFAGISFAVPIVTAGGAAGAPSK
jgi:S1-C subfamily serine protease